MSFLLDSFGLLAHLIEIFFLSRVVWRLPRLSEIFVSGESRLASLPIGLRLFFRGGQPSPFSLLDVCIESFQSSLQSRSASLPIWLDFFPVDVCIYVFYYFGVIAHLSEIGFPVEERYFYGIRHLSGRRAFGRRASEGEYHSGPLREARQRDS
ncbi:hypothetical protein OSTOST_17487 [Ostertagia ostertagi]